MSYVVANSHKFHVQRLGSNADAADAAPPVVMAHGLLLGSLASWYFTTAPALAKRHSVLLYDLRGHGRSDHAADGYDVANQSRDLAELTADWQNEPMVLVGHSFGALVCLRFALDHPERVAKLVLVEAPLPPSKFGEFNQFLSKSPEQMLTALPPETREFFERGSRQARRLLAQLTRLTVESTLVADLEAEADIPNAQLQTLACPTLCVYGTDSACRGVGDRLASVIPDGQLVELPGGHYLHLDAAAQLAARIEEFVDG